MADQCKVKISKHGLRALLLLLGAIAASGCSMAQRSKPPSVEEVARRERSIGSFVGDGFGSRLDLVKDLEVTIFLREVGLRIANVSNALEGAPLGVFLFRSGGSLRAYGLPGIRIYLPVELLRRCEYEHEVAAVLALQLAYIEGRAFVDALGELIGARSKGSIAESLTDDEIRNSLPQELDFFGPAGLFAYQKDQHIRAWSVAVRLLYGAGYDPRGLLGLIDHLSQSEHSGYDSRFLEQAKERVREAINAYPPLRNPVVRSSRYLKILKRVKTF